MAVLVWAALFVSMFALGYPIALGIMGSSVAYILLAGIDIAVIVDRMAVKFENEFVLIAVPLFILAARIMNEGEITERIFDFSQCLVGSLQGGLGHVNVVASIIFSGMTGSAVADASGLGIMEIKAMTDAGYDKPFSCAVTAASATIGPIIPPSIPMVIYSTLSGASIGYLFIGGVIPGLLLGISMMGYVSFIARRRGYPHGESFSLARLIKSFTEAFFPLLTPVILLWGIYGGVFTPTEAAAVTTIYATLVAVFGFGALGPRKIYAVLQDVVVATGYISFIVATAFLFSYVVAREQIPTVIASFIMNSSIVDQSWMMLLAINILFLILGLFLDTMVVLLIVVPILLPILEGLGIDLVHFGVVIVLNLMIGLSTPPYGVSLFIVSGLAKIPLSQVIREIWPFVVVMIAVLLLCTFVPGTVLLLPRLLGYQG